MIPSSSSFLPLPHTWIPETYEQQPPWLTFDIPTKFLNLILTTSSSSTTTTTTSSPSSYVKYGFYPLSIKFWFELIVGVTCMCCVASITAIVLYYNIILPQQQQREGQSNKKDDDEHDKRFIKTKLSSSASSSVSSSVSSSSTTTSTTRKIEPPTYTQTLLVYGILWPFWLIFPSIVVRQFQITNLIFRFSIGVIVPTLSLFRSTQGKRFFFVGLE